MCASALMSMWLSVYNLAQRLPFRGAGRIRKTLYAVMGNRDFKARYLEGYAWVNPFLAMEGDITRGRVYDRVIVDIIRAYTSEGYNFLDIGANVGLHTLAAAFARKSDQQTVLAYEPEPVTFSRLQRNIIGNGLVNVHCKQAALGESDGQLRINVSTTRNKGNHSLLQRPGTAPDAVVPVEALDKHPPPEGRGAWFVKMDVEGFEPFALRGAQLWIRSQPELALICEFSPSLLKVSNESARSLTELIVSLGFQHLWLVQEHDVLEPDLSTFFNVLCIKGSHSSAVLNTLNANLLSPFQVG